MDKLRPDAWEALALTPARLAGVPDETMPEVTGSSASC
jgi:hypothetical protein